MSAPPLLHAAVALGAVFVATGCGSQAQTSTNATTHPRPAIITVNPAWTTSNTTTCGPITRIKLPGHPVVYLGGCGGITSFANPLRASTARLHVGDVVLLDQVPIRPLSSNPTIAPVVIDRSASQGSSVTWMLIATAPGTMRVYIAWHACTDGVGSSGCTLMNFTVTR